MYVLEESGDAYNLFFAAPDWFKSCVYVHLFLCAWADYIKIWIRDYCKKITYFGNKNAFFLSLENIVIIYFIFLSLSDIT